MTCRSQWGCNKTIKVHSSWEGLEGISGNWHCLSECKLPALSLTCFVHNIVGTYQFCLGRSVVLLVDETSETVAARCSFQSSLDDCSNLPYHFQTVKLLMLVGINVTSTT